MKKTPELKQLVKEKLSPSALFLILVAVTELVFWIMALIPLDALGDLLFQNRVDTFMDYFHPLMTFERFSLDEIYTKANVFYPPLAMLFYLLMYGMMPETNIPEDDYLARGHQISVFPFFMLMIFIAIGLFCILVALRRGTELEKKLFAVVMLLSAPMLYLFERGNIILPALLFTLIFFCWKDSKSKLKRELALIALAIAAGLKIYPALFGLVLLFEKRWSEAIRCIIYGSLAFILPALVFGGLAPLNMIKGFASASLATFDEGFGYKINFSNTFAYLCSELNVSCSRSILNVIANVLGAVTFASLFIHREIWKRICIIAIIIAALPGMSYMYVLVFMFIPVVLFLNKCDASSRTPSQYLYSVIFALFFVLLPFSQTSYELGFTSTPYQMTFTTFAESIALILLSLIFICEAVILLFKKVKALANSKKQENTITE